MCIALARSYRSHFDSLSSRLDTMPGGSFLCPASKRRQDACKRREQEHASEWRQLKRRCHICDIVLYGTANVLCGEASSRD